ncbi:hypothetical protein GA0115256_13263 [Streptomyces sp. DconLS]|nr:hypothetical protein GA0115256_13263 [Streptomyces sp. DconLS]
MITLAYLPHDLPQRVRRTTTSPPGGTTGPTKSSMNSCAARSVSVHAAAGPRRHDRPGSGQRVPGRKRGLAVDVLGLAVAVVVLAANTHGNKRATSCLTRSPSTPAPPSARRWLTRASRTRWSCTAPTWASTSRSSNATPQDKGVVPQPRRWRVEQTYGILILHRRLVRDYEQRPFVVRLPRLLVDVPRHAPLLHRRERSHLARSAGDDRMNIKPLLNALDIQEDTAQAPPGQSRHAHRGRHWRLRQEAVTGRAPIGFVHVAQQRASPPMGRGDSCCPGLRAGWQPFAARCGGAGSFRGGTGRVLR